MGCSNKELSIIVNPSEGCRPDWYIAGSKLSGTVYAETNKKANDFAVHVIFTGKESTKVVYQANDDDRGPTRQSAFSKRNIIRVSIPLVEDSSLDAGQYAFPFEIQLPDDVPMSMNCTSKNNGYCRIIYKIKAEMTGKWRHVTNKIIIPVLAKPEPSNSPCLVSPVTETVKLCGFIPKGEVTFTAKVDKSRVEKGENVTISFACKNRSSTRIKSASVKLIQTIKWVSGLRHTEEIKNDIAKICIPLDEGMTRIPKVQNRQIKDSHNFESHEVKNSLYNELLETRKTGKNQGLLKVPDVLTSYCGNLIKVSYALVIKLKTPIFSSSPQNEIKLMIVESNSVTCDGCKSVTPLTSPIPIGYDETEITMFPITTCFYDSVYGGTIISGKTEEEVKARPTLRYEYMTKSSIPSTLNLRDDMEKCHSARSLIEGKLADEAWSPIFREMKPKNFADVVNTVKMEFDQVRVAVQVASAVNIFTCQYVVAILRSSCEWLRIAFVQNLLPMCIDVEENSNSILRELSEWEKICTKKDFDNVRHAT